MLKEIIAGIEQPGGAEVGEDEILIVPQVFFDLVDVVLRIGVGPPKRVGPVAQKKRFQFQRKWFPLWLGQHEIDPPFARAHLARGHKVENVLAERGKKVFRGCFRFYDVLEVEEIFLNGLVC